MTPPHSSHSSREGSSSALPSGTRSRTLRAAASCSTGPVGTPRASSAQPASTGISR
ncbi:hypothetical protein QNO07_02730 [Streptomyces sp. 549]|uniref:hypothetical protein n=1 Tax=Streptomyces sp. 549 TaxID=3049076 RepID=UPI0024C3D5E8|nr:hypothetical protein [Streptomyces sp. 549]MDK1472349.1 hypothetical protein [Streptomyces sp. 549]